jgi:hypothetical protein
VDFDEWNAAKQVASGDVEEKVARRFPCHLTEIKSGERRESFVVQCILRTCAEGKKRR